MTLALVGGDEFRPACEALDRGLLAVALGGPVRILPTAAAFERPELAAHRGVAHFRRLGVSDVGPVMVLDHADANDEALAAQVRAAGLIYLTGGSPAHLLRSLAGSAVLESLRGALAAGAVVAGSSAGAMVLGTWVRAPGAGWQAALGLAEGIAVLPHHERGGAEQVITYRAGLSDVVTLLGIDGATAVVAEAGAWRVDGAGSVTVYQASGSKRYGPGEHLRLD